MSSRKELFFVIFALSFLFIQPPSYAQDSLEVSVLDRMCHNFDSVQEIYYNGYYHDIVVNATDVYHAHARYTGEIWDFSHFSTQDTIHSICMENNVRYLANNNNGLSMINQMGVLHSYPEYGRCLDVVANGSTAYVATNRGFYILNSTDITNPALLDSLSYPGGLQKIVLDGNYIYASTTDMNLLVLDCSDTDHIVRLQTIELGSTINSMLIHSSNLYLLSQSDGMFIYSISSPANPSIISHPTFPETTFNMVTRNDTAWVACGENGITILDISDPENLTEIITYRGISTFVGLYENIIYSNTNNEYFTIYNSENINDLYIENFYGNNHVVDYFHDGYYNAFACDDNCGLVALDVECPDYIGGWYTFGHLPCRRVATEDSFAACITVNNEIHIFNSWRLHEPSILSTTELESKGTDLLIKDGILTVSLENGGFKNYSIFDLTQPVLISEIDTDINAKGIDSDEELLCLANADGELYTYDQSNPEQTPVLQSSLTIAEVCHEVLIHQRFAFVACGEEGVKIVDLYDPVNPEVVTTIDTDGTAYDITIGGWYFYIADGLNGVRVYDIHSPYNPQLVGYYDTPGNALRVFAWHENCGVADEDEFIVLRYAYATDAPEVESSIPSTFAIESVFPNPFNPDCHVKVNIPESGMMSLKVYNTLGQEVSSLSRTPVKAGSFEYQFFGKNHSSGVYILQVELERYGICSQKMVLLK